MTRWRRRRHWHRQWRRWWRCQAEWRRVMTSSVDSRRWSATTSCRSHHNAWHPLAHRRRSHVTTDDDVPTTTQPESSVGLCQPERRASSARCTWTTRHSTASRLCRTPSPAPTAATASAPLTSGCRRVTESHNKPTTITHNTSILQWQQQPRSTNIHSVTKPTHVGLNWSGLAPQTQPSTSPLSYLIGTTTQYLAADCVPVSEMAQRRHLCSAAGHQLVVPSYHLNSCGLQAFSVLGPRLWNSLPRLLCWHYPQHYELGHSLQTFSLRVLVHTAH